MKARGTLNSSVWLQFAGWVQESGGRWGSLQGQESQRTSWDFLGLYFQPGGNEVVGSSCVTLGKLLKLCAMVSPFSKMGEIIAPIS